MKGHNIVVLRCVKVRRQVLEACHDEALSGHVGISKTYCLVARHFEWDTLRANRRCFSKIMLALPVEKASTKAYAGKLQPLPIPGRRWEHVTVGYVSQAAHY